MSVRVASNALIVSSLVAAILVMSASSSIAQNLPPSVRAAGVTTEQWNDVRVEVQRAARARGASERALAAVAERVSANLVIDGRVDLDQLLASIDERAEQVADLQNELASMRRVDDPTVAELLAQAHLAIEMGDLDRGDQLLARAVASDLAGIARDRSRLITRQTRAAQIIAERAHLARASSDFLEAARLFADAAETMPSDNRHARWELRMHQAEAIKERGTIFGETARLLDLYRFYSDVVLPLASRSQHAADWAATQNDLGNLQVALGRMLDVQWVYQAIETFRSAEEVNTRVADPIRWALVRNNLGNALEVAGERGDAAASREAVLVLRDALTVRTRTNHPEDWADTHINLGNALATLGAAGDADAMDSAINSYRLALEVHTRDVAPALWASIQSNIGLHLATVGARGDIAALFESIAALRLALEIHTRDRSPEGWATDTNSLGIALATLGRAAGDAEALRFAVSAFASAMEVHTREVAPLRWAQEQSNMGMALVNLAELGELDVLHRAIAAFHSALEVRTPRNDVEGWAQTQFNLALGLRAMERLENRNTRTEAIAAAQAALLGFQQTGNNYWIEETHALLAQLSTP